MENFKNKLTHFYLACMKGLTSFPSKIQTSHLVIDFFCLFHFLFLEVQNCFRIKKKNSVK